MVVKYMGILIHTKLEKMQFVFPLLEQMLVMSFFMKVYLRL